MEDEILLQKEINTALRAAVMDMAIIPMIGSSLKNKGVQFMLDAVCKYLPSPMDKEGIEGIHPDAY
jgi:elongation factor G